MTTKPDDLEAVRTLVNTLSPFDASEQERIIRWSREKLGLPTEAEGDATRKPSAPFDSSGDAHVVAAVPRMRTTSTDIKSFIAEKSPTSDNQFAAAVAYYYRFEAPETARKEAITADDLQEACRLAGRARVPKPAQTLLNAHSVGLLDKAADRGNYAISTVGENLVAMALPSGTGKKTRTSKKSALKSKVKTASKKSSKKSKV